VIIFDKDIKLTSIFNPCAFLDVSQIPCNSDLVLETTYLNSDNRGSYRTGEGVIIRAPAGGSRYDGLYVEMLRGIQQYIKTNEKISAENVQEQSVLFDVVEIRDNDNHPSNLSVYKQDELFGFQTHYYTTHRDLKFEELAKKRTGPVVWLKGEMFQPCWDLLQGYADNVSHKSQVEVDLNTLGPQEWLPKLEGV